MRLRGGLLICLLLLRFAHGGKARGKKAHGRKPQGLETYFSTGIFLVVKGNAPTVPKIHILVPTSDPSGSGHSAVMCVVTGLHAGVADITWSINHTPVHSRHTSVQALRQKDGTYMVNAVLFLSEDNWSPQHTYRCTVTQNGRVYREQARPDSC